MVRFCASPKRPVLHGGSVMPSRNLFPALCLLFSVLTFTVSGSGQGIPPYPNAITDRSIHQETPMAPPPRNVVFADPDFGSLMVRATDSTTNFKLPGTFLRNRADRNPKVHDLVRCGGSHRHFSAASRLRVSALGGSAAIPISGLASDGHRCGPRRFWPPTGHAHSLRDWLDPSAGWLGVGGVASQKASPS